MGVRGKKEKEEEGSKKKERKVRERKEKIIKKKETVTLLLLLLCYLQSCIIPCAYGAQIYLRSFYKLSQLLAFLGGCWKNVIAVHHLLQFLLYWFFFSELN